eukprot:CAMPEP_0170183160 /NCGR_PEP_ID=MMETSP0040_2-20121228/29796_1 /TAXON_ID=641309 /ORGANISM="Lotharella oceanica, Strain CCMP622" /LENGTH=185 /DNA_ID=CAMNT_0010428803 /DNA_START=195 /DNA_END=752 /DNA_ORIENTATION=-
MTSSCEAYIHASDVGQETNPTFTTGAHAREDDNVFLTPLKPIHSGDFYGESAPPTRASAAFPLRLPHGVFQESIKMPTLCGVGCDDPDAQLPLGIRARRGPILNELLEERNDKLCLYGVVRRPRSRLVPGIRSDVIEQQRLKPPFLMERALPGRRGHVVPILKPALVKVPRRKRANGRVHAILGG